MPVMATSWLLWLIMTVMAIYFAPWYRLAQRDSAQIFFVVVLGLFLLWKMHAGTGGAENLHFLGASLASLMFGWEFAFIAVQLVYLMILASRPEIAMFTGWHAFASNVLLLGVIPAGLTHIVLRIVQKYLPANYFIYFFINTFFTTIAGILLISAVIWILNLTGGLVMGHVLDEYLPFMMLMAFPEGVFTGMLIAAFVMFKPEWVTTFRDEVYLKR